MIDTFGYIALSINLISMTMKNMRYLCVCSLIANSLYVVYGILLSAIPLIIGGGIAVIIQAYRISRLEKAKTGLADIHVPGGSNV